MIIVTEREEEQLLILSQDKELHIEERNALYRRHIEIKAAVRQAKAVLEEIIIPVKPE